MYKDNRRVKRLECGKSVSFIERFCVLYSECPLSEVPLYCFWAVYA